MTIIHDSDGNEIDDIVLSEKQRTLLEAGENVVMIYHTPQMLRYLLGEHSGSFTLGKSGEHVFTPVPDSLRAYAKLQRAIKAAREQH
jgi:hypothetical protein